MNQSTPRVAPMHKPVAHVVCQTHDATLAIGSIVGIKRALNRGMFVVTGFASVNGRVYAALRHENHAFQAGYVLASNVFVVNGSGWNPECYSLH